MDQQLCTELLLSLFDPVETLNNDRGEFLQIHGEPLLLFDQIEDILVAPNSTNPY